MFAGTKGMLKMDRVSDSRWFPELPGEEMQFAGEKNMDSKTEIKKMVIKNKKIQKGEIMKRASHSFFMGSWPVSVFVLAMFVLLVASTGANAQVIPQNTAGWTAATQIIYVSGAINKPGIGNFAIDGVTAGAIFGASDATGKVGETKGFLDQSCFIENR